MAYHGWRTGLLAVLASAVAVVAPTATGGSAVSSAAAVGPTLSGTVTARVGGAPLVDITVQLWGGDLSDQLLASDVTDASGHYSLPASDDCGHVFISDPTGEYAFDNTVRCTDVVAQVALGPGARLSSVVTDGVLGDPVEGVCVTVVPLVGFETTPPFGCTDSDGLWATPGMPSGFYDLIYTPPAESPLQTRRDRDVAVPVGSTTHDVALLRGGRVGGTVTADGTGLPLAGVRVRLEDQNDYRNTATAITDVDGSYLTTGVADGDWILFFDSSDPFVVAETFNDNDGQTIAIVDAADVTGVDVGLGRYADITGTVLDDVGAPVEGACIRYADGEGGGCLDSTDGSGGYEIPSYYTGFVDLVVTSVHHEFVQVTGETDENGGTIDVVLPRLHVITGHITTAVGGAPVGTGSVQASVPGDFRRSADVAPDGSYSLEVSVGDAVLHYTGPDDSLLADEYYDGAATAADATVVHLVGHGATTADIDFTLDVGGTLGGIVTDDEGAPLVGAVVTASDGTGGSRAATTDADGTYTVRGLQTGDATVRFDSPPVSPAYRSEYFDDTTEAYNGTPVAVVLGQPTNHIDAALSRYATIRGSITDAVSGATLPGSIEVLDSTGEYVDSVLRLDDTYEVDVLPGTYSVRAASRTRLGRVPAYWNGAGTFADSTPITVAAGETVSDIDFALGLPPAPTFVALASPQRLLDSRHAAGAADLGLLEQASGSIGHDLDARFVAGVAQRFVVTGVGGVPADPGGMALNVVAVNPAKKGYLTMYPCAAVDDSVPATSTLNFAAGVTAANAAIIDPDANGGLCIVASQSVDVVLDVTGYLWPGFAPLAQPQRLLDSRATQLGLLEQPDGWWGYDFDLPLDPGQPQFLQLTGAAGVPVHVGAVALNVVAVNPVAKGFVRVYPCYGNSPDEVPATSSLNFTAGSTVANSIVIRPGFYGGICVVANVATHLVIDVTGSFEYGFEADGPPQRLLDSRPNEFGELELDGGSLGADLAVPFAPGVVQRFVVVGSGGGTDVAGYALNITAVNPAAKGFVTVYPCASAATPVPATSTLNFSKGVTVANAQIIDPDASGGLCVVASQVTHLIIDATGTFR